jgi:hypothetical protein
MIVHSFAQVGTIDSALGFDPGLSGSMLSGADPGGRGRNWRGSLPGRRGREGFAPGSAYVGMRLLGRAGR